MVPTRRAVHVLLASLLASGCGGDAPSSAYFKYEGIWQGSTSQGLPIQFQVIGDYVLEMGITVSLDGRRGNTPCHYQWSYSLGHDNNALNPPMPIVADSFVSQIDRTSGDREEFSGRFSSNRAAAGTSRFYQNQSPDCPLTAPPVTITWTATNLYPR